MKDHDMRDIPDADIYGKQAPTKFKPKKACFRCGVWDTSLSTYTKTYEDCDKIFANPNMAQYREGGNRDPFASMRPAGCVTGTSGSSAGSSGAYTTGAAGGKTDYTPGVAGGTTLGSKGVGASGMPVRRDVPAQGNTPWSAPAEKRPGLAPETIDRDAYDEFMKGL